MWARLSGVSGTGLCTCIVRLKDMTRGELGSGGSTLSNKQFAQCWGLDETGNWSNFREDNTGAGTWTLNQSRTSNTVNEFTDITETVGASWVTPVYSRAGNISTVTTVRLHRLPLEASKAASVRLMRLQRASRVSGECLTAHADAARAV